MAALPLTGISTSLVANAIGVGSNDVGTLCTHSNVNIWSDHAPCEYDSVTGLTDAQFKKYKWKFISSFNGNSGSFVAYNKPTSKFRLGDFRGYDHNTPKPEFGCGASRTKGQNTTTFSASFIFPLQYDFSNISALTNGFTIGCIINNNTNYKIILNSEDNIEFYGSLNITGYISNSFTFKFGLVPLNALGEPGSGFLEFGILDGGVQFGIGNNTVVEYPNETQPTYMGLSIDLPSGEPTEITYGLSRPSAGIVRLHASFKVLENRPTGTFGVWVSVVKISDGSVIYPETLEDTITILSTNTINVDIEVAYSDINQAYGMLIAEYVQ